MAETQFKKYCEEQQLTARMVSEKTGIKMRTIYSYFSGERSPSRTTRKIIREKLGINTSEIFE